jgi:hypothetical protein
VAVTPKPSRIGGSAIRSPQAPPSSERLVIDSCASSRSSPPVFIW